MRVEFDQTEDDLIAAGAALLRYDPAARKQLAARRKVAAVLSLGGMVLLAFPVVMRIDSGTFMSAIFGAGFLGIAYRCWPTPGRMAAEAKGFARRVLDSPNGEYLLGPRSFEITRTALLMKTRVAESIIRWEAVGYVVRDDDYIYISIPGPALFAIPRGGFESDTKFDQFADAAEAAFRATHPG